MIQRFSNDRSQHGGVLVFSLLVLLVASFGMLAFVTLVQARGQVVNVMEEAIQRRVSQANAKVLATEYINRFVLPENGATNATLTFDSNWGTATVTNANSAPHGITGTLNNNHYLSPALGRGYAATASVTVNDGVSDIAYDLLLASRASQGTGEILQLHRSQAYPDALPTVDGLVQVFGGVRAWYTVGASAVSLRSQWYWAPEGALDGMADLSGAQSYPTNFSNVPMTMGVTATNRGYDGTLNVVRNGIARENSLDHKAVTSGSYEYVRGDVVDSGGPIRSDGNGRVEIRLRNSNLTQHVVIEGGATTLWIRGQETQTHLNNVANLPPLYIVGWDDGSPNRLSKIELIGENIRPVILAFQRQTRGRVVVEATSMTWRSVGYFENCELDFQVAGNGTLTWKGGLHTDSDLDVSLGALNIVREDDADKFAELEPYLPRHAWAELILD